MSDPRDRQIWSGTSHFMARSIEKHCGDLTYLGPIESRYDIGGRLLNGVLSRGFGKKYDYRRSPFLTTRYARVIHERLRRRPVDLIFATAAAPAVARLAYAHIPVISVSDTTFNLVNNYYQGFSGYLRRSIHDANETERLALQRSAVTLYPSAWAAQSAIADYGIHEDRIRILPFGANLEEAPSRGIAEQRRLSGECRLLFLGVDWVRKGGELAFETLLALEKNYDIYAHLAVCGCTPPPAWRHERLRSIGYLNKHDLRDRKQLVSLLEWADYLFVPTRKECFGIVFCEASAYGLPSIATDTGGVSGAVRNGENGFLLPEGAGPAKYAELIAGLQSDPQRYKQHAIQARNTYETDLNWDAWGRRVRRLIDEHVIG